LRILFVAMGHSIHTARWISQVKDQGWDIHLFPVEAAPLHPELEALTVHDVVSGRAPGLGESVRLVDDFFPVLNLPLPWPRAVHRARHLSRRLTQRTLPRLSDTARRLARVIRRLRPDVIHSLSLTPAGDLVLQASRHLSGGLPPWIVTNWGSEIYLWGRLPEHAAKIRAILDACDYYSCECRRDVELARAFGFKKQLLPVLPVAGGFDLEAFRQYRQGGPTSARRVIALKGYQGLAGRALVGLRAVELCADLLKGYRVCVYAASLEVKIVAELLAQSTGVAIEAVPECSHQEILRLHGSARASIGLSISDGISTSMLEAMVMGSFPIQSGTSCANEWVEDGRTGILVHPDDPEGVAAALRRAVADDRLVDAAARANDDVASERLDSSIIRPQAVGMYERAAGARRERQYGGV
jgi:glycosyltransferase involved in cell wall biosynthesis